MLCNSDFSERMGGWESVILVVLSVEGPARNIGPSTISRFSVEGHALDIEPSTISWFSVESHRSGYRTIHDFMVQRGRSPLWISNHPRFHGSAWKVPALDIEPSTISWFSVEGPARNIEPSTISWFSVEGPRPEAVTKRAERANGGTRAACFEQPEGVHSGCGDARPAKYTSSYSASTRPRMRLKSKCLFIAHHGDA